VYVGPEPGVVREIPAVVIGIVIEHDVIVVHSQSVTNAASGAAT